MQWFERRGSLSGCKSHSPVNTPPRSLSLFLLKLKLFNKLFFRKMISFAGRLNAPIAIIDKRRPRPNVSEIMNIIGDIKDKDILIIDDIIDTAGTLCNAANALKERGAKSVRACATHAILSGPAIERIKNSAIEELVILDTIPLPEEKKLDIIKVDSVAPLFAQAIQRIYEDKSVSRIFEKKSESAPD